MLPHIYVIFKELAGFFARAVKYACHTDGRYMIEPQTKSLRKIRRLFSPITVRPLEQVCVPVVFHQGARMYDSPDLSSQVPVFIIRQPEIPEREVASDYVYPVLADLLKSLPKYQSSFDCSLFPRLHCHLP